MTGVAEWGDALWDATRLSNFQTAIARSYIFAALIGLAFAVVAGLWFAAIDPDPTRFDSYGRQITIAPTTHHTIEIVLFIFPLAVALLYWMESKAASHKRITIQNADPQILKIRQAGHQIQLQQQAEEKLRKAARLQQRNEKVALVMNSRWFKPGRHSQLLVLALTALWIISVTVFEEFAVRHAKLTQAILLWVPALAISGIAFWWLGSKSNEKSTR